jgi:cell pole-organizing protein PopZ
MSQPAKAQEPSMEEILASIRRIIADDESKPAAKPAPPPASAPRTADVSPPPAPLPRPAEAPAMNQRDVDAMLATPDASPGGEAAVRAQQDILDLTESMAEPMPAPDLPNFQTIDGQPDVVFSDVVASEPAPRAVDEARRQHGNAAPPDRALLSNTAAAAVDSAFNTLAQTVLVHNARTLEDLVREMLRPMLKSWLDDNLPGMVERIVKAEIERVSRGRG